MSARRGLVLPSVETQTLAFVDAARQGGSIRNRWLEFAGFAVYLRYAQSLALTDGLVLGECITLGTLEVPARYRHRGWFWRYCQLCAALVEDGVVVESVVNRTLLASLRLRPGFVEYAPANFVLRKRTPSHWPLTIAGA
jgi:hypothetical protein